MKFVLEQLPGGISYREIEEMINTVDRNGDGKISFSEFRSVRPGGLQWRQTTCKDCRNT